MLDQNHELIRRMTSLGNIHGVIARLRNLKGEAIHSLSESERRIIRYLIDEGFYP